MCLSLQHGPLGGYGDEERIKGKHPTLSSLQTEQSSEAVVFCTTADLFHLSFSLPFYSSMILVFAVTSYRERQFLFKVQAQLYAVVQGGLHRKLFWMQICWDPASKKKELVWGQVYFSPLQNVGTSSKVWMWHWALVSVVNGEGTERKGCWPYSFSLGLFSSHKQPEGKLRLIKFDFLKSCFISLHWEKKKREEREWK